MANPPTVSACGSPRCRAAIRYVHLIGHGDIPVDMHMEPGGEFMPTVDRGVKCARARRLRDYDAPGFTAHWNTCPDPAFWELPRRRLGHAAARPAGEPGPRPQDFGPCACCRTARIVAYGPHCKGLLCDDCARSRAALLAGERVEHKQDASSGGEPVKIGRR